jgi:hypothetical protein
MPRRGLLPRSVGSAHLSRPQGSVTPARSAGTGQGRSSASRSRAGSASSGCHGSHSRTAGGDLPTIEAQLLVGDGRALAAWMVAAFLVTFLVTRFVTHAIRSGRGRFRNASMGGVHVHHQVYGIFLMLMTGAAEFTYRPDGPWVQVLAVLFGSGAVLTLDEFALWLRLDDVYWSEEGRASVDAVLVALVAACRLARPASPWARRSRAACRVRSARGGSASASACPRSASVRPRAGICGSPSARRSRYCARSMGVREIARRLGRSPSTISRKLRRNAATRGGRLDYRAGTA